MELFHGSPGQPCDGVGALHVTSAAGVVAALGAQPLGPHWGIGGYSEGGFCAANLALRHPASYGIAASMCGYYQPPLVDGIDRSLATRSHGSAMTRCGSRRGT